MSMDLFGYQPVGDKRNSDFFNEYRLKIYERRKNSGLEDLLDRICGLVIQVDHGNGIAYLAELFVMTSYRLAATYRNDTHRIFALHADEHLPWYFVLEPFSVDYTDDLTRVNLIYPLSRATPNARYIGEIIRTANLGETVAVLESHDVRFHAHKDEPNAFFANEHMAWTRPSDFTFNRVGYSNASVDDVCALRIGEPLALDDEEQRQLDEAVARSDDLGLDGLLLGVDHMATRVLAGEREDAILEFLTMSNYYFWGAYNIADQNSSTNVNRHPGVSDDKHSPAKVFTANNTPSFVNSFEGLPMPTENFVRNYGRRMHHVAIEVRDGDHPSGKKNVDYVVDTLRENGVKFLAQVVGECVDTPNLKQIFSKHSRYSLLITEYVERCFGFQGFFTKSNVAELTEAAGKDEELHHVNVFD